MQVSAFGHLHLFSVMSVIFFYNSFKFFLKDILLLNKNRKKKLKQKG